MADRDLWPGRLVIIDAGKHGGKIATFLGHDVVLSGQTQLYPVVALPDGREVRVRSVTPLSGEIVDSES